MNAATPLCLSSARSSLRRSSTSLAMVAALRRLGLAFIGGAAVVAAALQTALLPAWCACVQSEVSVSVVLWLSSVIPRDLESKVTSTCLEAQAWQQLT